MTLLGLLAAQAGGPTPDPDPELPYAVPTSYPYNAPIWSPCPTPDDSGSAIHPSAWDFGPAGWRGHRFWMANTPYLGQDITKENPCVWVSDNGHDWQVPDGGRNPLYATPGGNQWFSDTDVTYDPATDRLVLVWRGPGDRINVVTSDDGVTWPATIADVTPSLDPAAMFLAPSLVRLPNGTWRLYGNHNGTQGWCFYTSPNPTGPWTFGSVVSAGSPWHGHFDYDATLALFTFTFMGAISTSRDGVTFGHSARVLQSHAAPLPGMWETREYYMQTVRRFDATHFSIWYANSPDGVDYYTGYSRFPASLLPAPGGAAL